MKNIRIIFAITAIVFAFGGTFALQYDAKPNINGFEYIPATAQDPEQCIPRSVDCQVSGKNSCMLNGNEVKDANTETQCGALLKRP